MPIERRDIFGRDIVPSPYGRQYTGRPVGTTRLWDRFIGRGDSEAASPTAGKPFYYDADPMQLSAAVNAFMTDQAAAPYRANLPDYQNMISARSGVIGSQLAGEVPGDVLNQIIQRGAERGIMTGAPGSANTNAAWMSVLGQTSLGIQESGLRNLNEAIASTPIPELLNPASIMVPERTAAQEYARYLESRNPITWSTGPGSTMSQLPTPYMPGAQPTFSFSPR